MLRIVYENIVGLSVWFCYKKVFVFDTVLTT
jgi:hypothetical protein